MAGLMQWFQVTCPKCTGALQVRLPEGVTSVQCSQCKAVFAVQVQPIALAPPNGPVPPVKRSRKRKKDGSGGGGLDADGQPSRTLSAYNVFMKSEVARVKAEHPQLAHREAFKLAAERWQASPMNPQNGGDRFPLKVPPEGIGGAAAPMAGPGGMDAEYGNGAGAAATDGYDGNAADNGGAAATGAGGDEEGDDGEEDVEEDDGGGAAGGE